MADFCITKVRYAKDRNHIEWVHVHEEKPTTIGAYRVVPRAFIADLIRLGKATFITRTWDDAVKTWKFGADVHLTDDIFITTDRNTRKRDNLENLPEF